MNVFCSVTVCDALFVYHSSPDLNNRHKIFIARCAHNHCICLCIIVLVSIGPHIYLYGVYLFTYEHDCVNAKYDENKSCCALELLIGLNKRLYYWLEFSIFELLPGNTIEFENLCTLKYNIVHNIEHDSMYDDHLNRNRSITDASAHITCIIDL